MATTRQLDAYHFYEEEWADFDDLRAGFEWEIPAKFNIAAYACDRWADEKRRVALFDDSGETWTFWQLRNRANRLANYLREQGIERGDRIAVSGSQRPTGMVGHLAAWKLGAVSVPLSVLLGPDGLGYRLRDCDASAFLVDGECAPTLRDSGVDVEHVLTTGEAVPQEGEVALADALDGKSREFETVETAHDEDAIMIYTSGTTGRPKGVVQTHDILLGVLPCLIAGAFDMDVQEGDVGRTVVEWSWAGALNDFVLPHWFYGLPVVGEPHGEFDPEAEFERIERYGVTILNGPPTALRMMMQVDSPAQRWDLSSVRAVWSGGEAVGQSIVEWADETFAGAVVHEGYGQTEAPAFIGDCSALGVDHRPGCMGCPSPGSDVTLIDSDGNTGAEYGEIALRYEGHPGTFDRYWQRPEKTDSKVEDGWLLTEDLGEDREGYVAFDTRKDDVIISSGYRIGPEEVEEAIVRHDAVANAGVIGVPDETRGEAVKAFVVLAAGHEPGEDLKDDIRSFVRESLAKYEYPRQIAFIDELPTTTSGKVRRMDLREREGLD